MSGFVTNSTIAEQHDDAEELPSMALMIRQALAPASSRSASLRDSYEKRLRTFSPATYFAKPHSLSPLVCARLGFENVGTNLLKCTGCRAALEINLPASLSVMARCDLTCRLEQELVAVHGEACPFRRDAISYIGPEDDSAQRSPSPVVTAVVPMLLAQVWRAEIMDLLDPPMPLSVIRQRWNEMTQIIQSIFLLKKTSTTGGDGQRQTFMAARGCLGFQMPEQLLEAFEYVSPEAAAAAVVENSNLLSRLLVMLREKKGEQGIGNDNDETLATDEQVEKEALALVLCGWTPVQNAPAEQFHCQCLVCGSHLRGSVDAPNDDDSASSSPRMKRARTSAPLDPLQGHRHYCPFVCGFPRRGAAQATPLWRSVVQRLLDQVRDEDKAATHKVPEESATTRQKQLQTPANSRMEIHKILQSGISPMRPSSNKGVTLATT